jgi:PBP1b-binding outer membrane lipoprotein LpoB
MRNKFLTVLCLASFLFLAGCKGETNTNVAPTPTPIAKTSETPATDMATVKKIEDALKAKGFADVKVDGSTKPITLRGTVAKGKLGEVAQVAQEAAGTPVKNEVVEK